MKGWINLETIFYGSFYENVITNTSYMRYLSNLFLIFLEHFLKSFDDLFSTFLSGYERNKRIYQIYPCKEKDFKNSYWCNIKKKHFY